MKRRQALKSVGSLALGSTLIPTIASSRSTARNVFAQSLKILEKTGDHELKNRFLRKRGFDIDERKARIAFPPAPEDDVSTQLDKNSFEVSIGLYRPNCDSSTNEDFAQMSWAFDAPDNDICKTGDMPEDRIGLTWKEGAWYVPDGTDAFWGSDKVFIKSGDYDTNGISFRFKDAEIDSCVDDVKVWHYGAAPVRPADSSFTDGSRQVWGVYSHTSGEFSLKSLSLNFGVITWDSSMGNPEVWQANEDQDGNDLLVSDDDFVDCYQL